MTHTLFETIRRIVHDELGRVRTAELGVVQEQHPRGEDGDAENYECTVRLRDSGLVLRRVPVATQRVGVVSIPAVGEMVLVQFVGGEINAPVITGRLYTDEERPPPSGAGQLVLHLPLEAAEDEAVHFELHSGETRELLLALGGGLEVALRDDDPAVEVTVDGGKAVVRIDRDGAVTLETGRRLKLKAGELDLEADSVSIEAAGELNLKGGAVNIN